VWGIIISESQGKDPEENGTEELEGGKK